jgi:hypothetical protein
LAKSVNGESGVWKVEELIEKSDETTPEEVIVEEETETFPQDSGEDSEIL